MFFDCILVCFIKVNTSNVCRAIIIIKIPSTIYQIFPPPCISLPKIAASAPRVVKVTPMPIANTTDNLKAFLVSLLPIPPMHPITRGILVSEHGVKDVKTPAKNAINGAIQ